MKCQNCNWTGNRCDLTLHKFFNDTNEEIIDLSNWAFCPVCSSPMELISKHLDYSLGLEHNNAVLRIHNPSSTQIIHVHLGRLLDFKISSTYLILQGYKTFTNSTYILPIPCVQEYDSKLLLKILKLLHKNKYNCESHEYENLKLFGKWKTKSIFPDIKCSFCARIYEFENNVENGWPLSIKKIEEENLNYIRKLAGVPTFKKNRKFSLIFDEFEEPEEVNKICWCNEISPTPNPNCALHKGS